MFHNVGKVMHDSSVVNVMFNRANLRASRLTSTLAMVLPLTMLILCS